MVPSSRVLRQNSHPINADGEYVLYWMIAARRSRYNFSLQRAVGLAAELRKPLVVLEAIRADYPFASDRLHTFVIEGMADNARDFARTSIAYHPYIEPTPGAGSGVLDAYADAAAAVVTDWYPAFFLPRMVAAAAATVRVAMEAIDSNTLIPVADHGRAFPTARGYRAFMQRELRTHLEGFPDESPIKGVRLPKARIPPSILQRWPAADLDDIDRTISHLPIDHSVPRVAMQGGSRRAARALELFIDRKLRRYHEDQNHPDADGTSRLSPYLHFGHLSVHELFGAVMTTERWTTRKLTAVRGGAREGWWGVSAAAEAFLDQITVWRELAFNGCHWTEGYGSYATLPSWARQTLESHLRDPRPKLYSYDDLDAAETDDEVWNAIQRELKQDGWFHGYLRMVWGKKMLEWTRDPAEVLDRMERLMNRYSLDGRDPVSSLNYAWVLGQHDRPWPERPIFGTVRYMTTASTRRKLRMKEYLRRFGK